METAFTTSGSLVYFSLGSNLGDRLANLKFGIDALEASHTLVALSPIVESESWGYDDPNAYLNMVASFTTQLTAFEVRSEIARIETLAGRQRNSESGEGYEARTLDIDILFFGDEVVEHADLQIPHPRLHLRNFVLEPLVSLAPDLKHPVLLQTITELLNESPDQTVLKQYAPGL